MPPESLERLTERLEHAAAALRTEELPAEEAAALVEECARVAGEAGAELDRQATAAGAAPTPAGPAGRGGGRRSPAGGPAGARLLSYPEHLRDEVEAYLAALTFSAESPTDGLQ